MGDPKERRPAAQSDQAGLRTPDDHYRPWEEERGPGGACDPGREKCTQVLLRRKYSRRNKARPLTSC